MRIALFYLKLTILFLLLASFGYLASQTILKYKDKESNLAEKETRYLSQPKIVPLTICVDIRDYVGYEYDETMFEIERATDGALNDQLVGIYTSYQSRLFSSKYQIHQKVLFKDIHRCFHLSIHPNYQIAPSNPKLTIKLKNKQLNRVYLLSEKEDLNSESFYYSGRSVFVNRIVKRLRTSGRCVDYEEKYAGNCTNRWNCVERCVQRQLMNRFNRIALQSFLFPVIDRDWFSPIEWNSSKLITDDKIFEAILENCTEEIPNEKPCDEIKFEEITRSFRLDYETVEINLQFDVIRSIEERPPPGTNWPWTF